MAEAVDPIPPARKVAVGRRLFLGMAAVGAAGIAAGATIQRFVGRTVGSGLGGIIPGSNTFRFYSITDTFPSIPDHEYRLTIGGLVERELTFTLADLKAMPSTRLVKDFQCVTGWRVPQVHWEGVQLGHLLDTAGVKSSARALSFSSYDGADSESLTLEQARRSDVIVAYSMLGGPITSEHGGPVRLYVAPMYGYKSLKWLRTINVLDVVVPGFWEQNGYAVDGWVGRSNGRTDNPID